MSAYKQLRHEISRVVSDEAKHTDEGYTLRYDDLDTDTQDNIVAYFLDYDERDLFSIYENDKLDDIASSLISMLRKNTRESEEDFASCIKKNLRAYYARRAQELIDECCAESEREEAWEHGYVKRQNGNNGEYYWSHI